MDDEVVERLDDEEVERLEDEVVERLDDEEVERLDDEVVELLEDECFECKKMFTDLIYKMVYFLTTFFLPFTGGSSISGSLGIS